MSRRRAILIVEDDMDLRRMLRYALMLDGFDVQEAGDGLDALRLLDGTVPDAVILDLGLPVVSGHAVRQEIAAQAHMRHIPVIVVTGQPGPHDTLDVACVLQKPISTDQLIRTVRSCIASGGAEVKNS
jgi:DNA-binding response OmpR family regulator